MAGGRVVPLAPNPPPTCGEMTRTWSLRRPRTSAIVSRSADGPWVESYTVRFPRSSQDARLACGSIGLLCRIGVVYVTSTRVAAAARPASTSPYEDCAGYVGLTVSGW